MACQLPPWMDGAAGAWLALAPVPDKVLFHYRGNMCIRIYIYIYVCVCVYK